MPWIVPKRGALSTARRESDGNGGASVEVFKFEEGPEAIATKSIEYLKRVFSGGVVA